MQGSYITTYCAKNTLEGLQKISFMVNVMLIISTYQSLLKIPILAHIIVFWLKEPPALMEYYPSFEFAALAAEQVSKQIGFETCSAARAANLNEGYTQYVL